MNLFELTASITLDTSDYDKGIQNLDSSANGAKQSLEQIGQGASNAGNELSSLGSQSSSVGNEMGSLGNEASSAGSEMSGLGQEAGATGEELASLGEEASATGEEMSSLGEEASSAGEEQSSLGQEASSAGEELSSLGEEASSAGEEESSLGQEASSAGEEVSSLGQEASSVGGEMSSLAQEVVSVTIDLSDLGQEASSAGEELSSAGGESSSFASELASLAGEASSAGSSISDLGSQSESSGSIMKDVLGGNILTSTVSKAWNSITSSIDGAISRVDTLNNYTTVMQNLGYTTEQADEATTKLVDGIEGLPTTLDSIVSWQQTFTALSGDIEESTDLTVALNNATLAGGQGQEKANTAMQAWYNCIAQGKPTATYWRQMVKAMPAQMDELSKSILGDTASSQDLFDAWQGGTVTTEEVEAALIDLNENGYGEMASYAQQAIDANAGIGTSMTNLKTAVTKGVANIITAYNDWAEDSSFPTISGAISSVKDVVNDLFKNVTAGMPDVLNTFASLASSIGDNLQPVFNTISDVMTNQVMPAFSEVSSFLTDTFSGSLNDTGSTIGDMLTPVIQTLGDILTNVIIPTFENVASFVTGTVVPAFSEIGSFISENIIPAFGTMETTISSNVQPILDTLSGFISNTLVPALESIGTWISEKVMPFISDMATFIAQNVIPVISDLASWAVEHLVPAFQSIGNFIMDTVMPALKDLWNIFSESILPVIKSVGGYITDSFIPIIETIATAIINTVMPVLKKFSAFFSDNIVPVIQAFYDTCNTVVAGVIKFFNNLGTNISNFVDDIKKFFTETIPKAFETAYSKIREWVDNVKKFFTETIPKAVDEVVTAFKNLPTQIKKWLDNVISKISEWATNLKDSAVEAVTGFTDNIVDNIKELPSKFKEEIDKIIDKVKEWIVNLKENGLSAAKDFIDSIIQGIQDGIANVVAKVQELGQSIIDGIKSFFGFGTSSSKTKEQGTAITDDLVDGAVEEAGSSRTTSALNSMGETINSDVDDALGISGGTSIEAVERGKTYTDSLTGSMADEAGSTTAQDDLSTLQQQITSGLDSTLGVSNGEATVFNSEGAAIFQGISSGALTAEDMYADDDIFEFVTEYQGKMYSTFDTYGFLSDTGEAAALSIPDTMNEAIKDTKAQILFNTLAKETQEQVDNALGTESDAYEAIENLGKVNGEALPDGMDEGVNDTTAKQSIADMKDSLIQNAVTALGIEGESSTETEAQGKRLGHGFTIGAKEGATDSTGLQYINDTSDAIRNSFNTYFGIEGDSSTKTEETGKRLGHGFTIGTYEGAEDATSQSNITRAVNSIKDSVDGEIQLIQNGKSAKILQPEGEYITEGMVNSMADASDSQDTKSKIAEIKDNIIQNIDDEFQINSPAKVMEPEGEYMEQGVVEGFKNLANNVAEKFEEMGTTVDTWAINAVGRMRQAGEYMAIAVSNGMSDLSAKVQEVLDAVGTTISNWASSLSNNMRTYGSNSVTGFSNGMVSNTSGIYSSVQTIASNIKNGFNLYDSMVVLGKNLMIGLNNGLVSGSSSVYSTARTIANNISNTINSALKTHSPSKVTEETGENVDQGLAVGMENGISEIQKAVGDVVDATDLSGLQASIDSNILTGDYAISAVGTVESSTAGANTLDKIADMLDQYLPTLANLKVVLDSGTVVGELEEKIDKALGGRQSRRERYAI